MRQAPLTTETASNLFGAAAQYWTDAWQRGILFLETLNERGNIQCEQAAKEAVLFLDDPVAAAVLANEDDRRCRATRWRFDELHVSGPSDAEQRVLPKPQTFRRWMFRMRMFGWLWSGDCLTHAPNIFPAGYEFEGDKTEIS